MIWPFKRKNAVPTRPRLNEDWRVGDLAVALTDFAGHGGPARGSTARVIGVVTALAASDMTTPTWGLKLEGYVPNARPATCFDAFDFRKALPDEEPAEAAFVEQMRACKPQLATTDKSRAPIVASAGGAAPPFGPASQHSSDTKGEG